MRHAIRLLLNLVILLLITRHSARADGLPPSIDDVRRDYSAALEKIEIAYKHLKGSGQKTSETANRVTTESAIEFAESGESRFVRLRIEAASNPNNLFVEEVWGQNLKYQFRLQKLAPDDPFAIKDYVQPSKSDDDSATGRYNARCGVYLNASHTIIGEPLSTLLDDPGFTITETKRVEHQGKDMIRIAFQCTDKMKVDWTIRSGSLIVCPAEGWPIYRWDALRGKIGVPAWSEVEYSEPIVEVALPRRVHTEITGDASAGKHDFFFDNIGVAQLPEGDFTLSAFGMPEVGSVKTLGDRSLAFWFFGFAAFALIVAVILRRLATRQTTPTHLSSGHHASP